MKKYIVILDSVGNPQNPNNGVWGVKPNAVGCTSLLEASCLCQSFIEKYDLGAGNWGGNAGKVLDEETKKQVARISYNGKVWDMNNNLIKL